MPLLIAVSDWRYLTSVPVPHVDGLTDSIGLEVQGDGRRVQILDGIPSGARTDVSTEIVSNLLKIVVIPSEESDRLVPLLAMFR